MFYNYLKSYQEQEKDILHKCINNIWQGDAVKQQDGGIYPDSIAKLKERYDKKIKIYFKITKGHFEVVSKKRCMVIFMQEGAIVSDVGGRALSYKDVNGMFPIFNTLLYRYDDNCNQSTSKGESYKAGIICYIEE